MTQRKQKCPQMILSKTTQISQANKPHLVKRVLQDQKKLFDCNRSGVIFNTLKNHIQQVFHHREELLNPTENDLSL